MTNPHHDEQLGNVIFQPDLTLFAGTLGSPITTGQFSQKIPAFQKSNGFSGIPKKIGVINIDANHSKMAIHNIGRI